MTPVVAWLWAGLVLGVSFLATPIKFQAASLTRPVALDVGRTTFHALAKAEWLLTLVLVTALVLGGNGGAAAWICFGGVVAIAAVQALYLIPRLDSRVEAVIAGTPMGPSHLHTAFAVIEGIKVGLLLAIGFVGG